MDRFLEAFFSFPEIEGLVRRTGVDSKVQIIVNDKFDDFLNNFAHTADIPNEEVNSIIDKVVNYFSDQNKQFSWVIGPYEKPNNLKDILLNSGFSLVADSAAMVFTHMDRKFDINPDVKVRQASFEEMKQDKIINMIAESFDFPKEAIRGVISASEIMHEGGMLNTQYLAYWKDEPEPVAWGAIYYYPDRPECLLGGAATREEYRKRGFYTALLSERVKNARERGRKALIIEAAKSTSAPVVKKHGFVDTGTLQRYVLKQKEE
ncbi:MAG: GNAT family N-acetyltransferase [Candidatus Kariarchaeaceae archaeon]|jgi:GNAT superfamily N-acetyltransferase